MSGREVSPAASELSNLTASPGPPEHLVTALREAVKAREAQVQPSRHNRTYTNRIEGLDKAVKVAQAALDAHAGTRNRTGSEGVPSNQGAPSEGGMPRPNRHRSCAGYGPQAQRSEACGPSTPVEFRCSCGPQAQQRRYAEACGPSTHSTSGAPSEGGTLNSSDADTSRPADASPEPLTWPAPPRWSSRRGFANVVPEKRAYVPTMAGDGDPDPIRKQPRLGLRALDPEADSRPETISRVQDSGERQPSLPGEAWAFPNVTQLGLGPPPLTFDPNAKEMGLGPPPLNFSQSSLGFPDPMGGMTYDEMLSLVPFANPNLFGFGSGMDMEDVPSGSQHPHSQGFLMHSEYQGGAQLLPYHPVCLLTPRKFQGVEAISGASMKVVCSTTNIQTVGTCVYSLGGTQLLPHHSVCLLTPRTIQEAEASMKVVTNI
ncbi:hypothetical protein DFH09DRAFT_1348007 [Mycena vulgaris]|nr:hypothetical protein DFH09DRAFT_1348007 [Mycena vulgaris]